MFQVVDVKETAPADVQEAFASKSLAKMKMAMLALGGSVSAKTAGGLTNFYVHCDGDERQAFENVFSLEAVGTIEFSWKLFQEKNFKSRLRLSRPDKPANKRLSPPLPRHADNCETADSATATTIDTA